VLCFICYYTPVSVQKIEKNQRKENKKKRKMQKRRKRRGKGLYCGLLTEKISLHIQILGDLYTSNIISFEYIKPLDF